MNASPKLTKISFLRFVAALVVLLGGGGGAPAQEKPGPKAQPSTAASKLAEPEAAKAAPSQKEESRGGPQEGIKVHGHWVIVVKNSDGSVASRHQFENALTSGGALALTTLLTQAQTTAPVWSISVSGYIGPGSRVGFFITTTAQGVNGTVVLSGSGKPPLFGSQNFYQLTTVDSAVQLTGSSSVFTSRDLTQPVPPSAPPPPPINVQPGQTIDVTVTISFS